jgi:peptidoglycan/LPS O-acetylase OafA/YrhL
MGRGLFSLWLAGAAVYLVLRPPYQLPVVILLVGASAAAFMAITSAGSEYDFRGYPLLAAVIFGIVASTQSSHLVTSEKVGSVIAFFADYSFTLYLIHSIM